MKKILVIFLGLVVTAFFIGIVSNHATALKSTCTTIKDGVLTYSAGHYLAGQPLKPGFDIFGYNYQAHLFNGYYANAYLGREGLPPYEGNTADYLAQNPSAASKWYWPYRNDVVNMKWNDAWLSNMDCNGDYLLDRPDDFGGTYIGSGAWETNHQSGTYPDGNGKECHWTYFVKIIAAPADATKVSGIWYATDGKEIGPSIWGAFAIIEEVYNDPCGGYHGILYLSPAGPGFGKW